MLMRTVTRTGYFGGGLDGAGFAVAADDDDAAAADAKYLMWIDQAAGAEGAVVELGSEAIDGFGGGDGDYDDGDDGVAVY